MAPALFTDYFRGVRAACAATSLIALVGCPAAAQPTGDIDQWRPRRAAGDPDQVAVRAAQSVVQVVATGRAAASDGIVRITRLVAAGAIVDDGRHVLTSAQLVGQATWVDVVLPQDAEMALREAVVPAEVVGVVLDLDLALLRIPESGRPALPLAATTPLTGDAAITVAPADTGRHTRAVGIVLSAGAPVCAGSPVPYLVTDAAPGAAGAAVVNLSGELIGVAAAFAGDGVDTPRATAALPAAVLRFAIEQMQLGVPFRRGIVGLSADSVVLPWADRAAISGQVRLVVSAVAPGLPAAQAGLQAGDVIVGIDGKPVDGMPLTTLFLTLYTLRDGQTLTLDVQRHGQRLSFAPTATAVPEGPPSP